MQSSVPVASVTPVTASPSNGKPLPVLTDFGNELTKLLAAIAPVGTMAPAAASAVAAAAQPAAAPGSSPANAAAQQLPASLVATNLAPAAVRAPVPKPMPPMPADVATARFRPIASMRRGAEAAHSDMTGVVDAQAKGSSPQVAMPVAVPPPLAASAPESAEGPQLRPAAAAALSTLPDRPPMLPPDAQQSAELLEAAVDHDAGLEQVNVPAATVGPAPSPSANTTVPSPTAQIAATLVSMHHAPNDAQWLIMKPQSPEPDQIEAHIDQGTDGGPAHVAIAAERPERPFFPATEQTAVVQMPPPPSVVGVPDIGSLKTLPASNVAAARFCPATAMRPDTGNNATGGTEPTAGAGDEQLILGPISVQMPTTADPQPAQPAQLATDAPDRTPEPQKLPPTATPVSKVAKQPLVSPPDTSQPAALGESAALMPREAAADTDTKPERVTAPAASIAPMPSLPATPSMRTPTTPAATPGTPYTSPATQIAPALVSLSRTPDGAQRLTMKLEPPELGQVQIRIDRPVDNTPARIAITVERAETLQLLLRDQPQLQRALDQAGVPAEGRTISFHVATPEPAARSETAVAPAPTGSSSAMGGDLSYDASRQGGRSAQPELQQSTTGSADDNATVEAIPIMPMRWQRAGLDITA